MNENAEAVDVAGLTQNPKALKKLLMAQIRAQGGTAAVDSKSIVHGLIKQTLEAFLELEMEEHLGYPQYAAEGRGSGKSRNGSTGKTVRGDFGEVEIETPRDRKGDFDPKIVAKRQTSVGNFTEMVISLYARGMSTREIEDHVKQIYGAEICPTSFRAPPNNCTSRLPTGRAARWNGFILWCLWTACEWRCAPIKVC